MIPTSITLGPFTIPFKLILFIAAAASAHLLLYILKRKDLKNFKRASDFFFNSAVLFLLGWRLSLILTNWSTFRAVPTALLYLPGGILNHLAGALLVLISIPIVYKHKKYSPQELIRGILLTTGSVLLYFISVSLLITLPVSSRFKGDSLKSVASQPANMGSETGEEISGSATGEASIIKLMSIEGEETGLDLTGAPVTIVNFWASWCPPCRAEIPELTRFYSSYKESDVRFLTVNMTSTEKSIDSAIEFIMAEQAGFPVLLDHKGEAAAYFKIISVPTTLVFNTRGELIVQKSGAVDFAWLKNASGIGF